MRVSKTNTNQIRILPFTPSTIRTATSRNTTHHICSVRIQCFFCWSVHKSVYTSNVLAKLTRTSIWRCTKQIFDWISLCYRAYSHACHITRQDKRVDFVSTCALSIPFPLKISLSLFIPLDFVAFSLSDAWAHNEITIYLRQHTVMLNWKCR